MKALKLVIILCTAFNFAQCDTLKLTDNTPFKITAATYNNWIGGRPGISGIEVNIIYKSENKITFDKIYFHNRIVKIENRIVKGEKYIIGYFNTSTREHDVFLENDNTPKEKAIKSVDFPFNLKENEAIISFKKGNKIRYHKVINIKKIKTDFYP